MGKTNVYGKRTLVQATLKIGLARVFYGFLTAVDATERGALGLTDVTGGAGSIVIGANMPKPTRMIKREGEYTVSSFVSTDGIPTALATAKWKIQKAGRRYRHSAANVLTADSKRAVCAYVPIQIGTDEIKYAWRIPSYQAAKIGNSEVGELGIVIPATDLDASDMIFGINNIKPAKASKSTAGTTAEASFTLTMPYDATQTLTSWTPVSGIKVKSSGVEF